MTDNLPPRIWGAGVKIRHDDVQAAIEEAGRFYLRWSGKPPTHVCLPPGTSTDGLNLWTLSRGHDCGPGLVICGRPEPNGSEPG